MTAIDVQSPPSVRPWWMENAGCQGKSRLFFPPPGERPAARERRETRARKICLECNVLHQCQDYARTQRELGFWGGESEIERAEAGYAPTTPVIGLRRHRTATNS
ncbi:MAG: WhiB family transcriptional regulator [Actinomycetota bacterium]|nr:WhiB family transcriptional regulator [Actinomycetota bacterium]